MSSEEDLLQWYSTLHTTKVDIVGDFAGGELFGIHGESLIHYCMKQSRVDFHDGFQLLHAVFAVEKFLDDLQKRGCNFDVLFFRDLDDVCVPEGAAAADAYKYHLARAVVIQHLSRSNIRSEVHEFDSFESDDCKEYLSSHTLHFVLCHEGDGNEGPKIVQLRHLIWKLSNSGRHVALFNHITWQTSKVFVNLLDRTKGETALSTINSPSRPVLELSTLSNAILDKIPELDTHAPDLTLREWFAVHFCRSILEQPSSTIKVDNDTLTRLHGLLLHTATLRLCSLQERRCDIKDIGSDDESFLHLFSEVSKALIERGLENCELDWDLFDLIDGRIFSFMLDTIRTNSPVPEEIAEKAKQLWKEVVNANTTYSDADFDVASQSSISSPASSNSSETPPTILSFDHPAFNKFLGNIEVKEIQETANSAAGNVFEDLEHWHKNKPVTTAPPLDFYAKRRNQRQMADIITYAQSLQSGGGKILERESIVVRPQRAQGKGTKPLPGKDVQKKGGKKPVKKGGKGGKESAFKVVQEIQDRKIRDKRDSAIRLWAERCAEFQKEPNLVSRYLKAEKFLSEVSRKDRYLDPEIYLYFCHILSSIWVEARKNESKMPSQGLYLIAMMWNSLQAIARSGDCTPEIAGAVQGIVTSLRMPQIDVTVGNPSRALPFFIDTQVAKQVSKLVQDYRILQLEHGGPYMERRFDSQPDPRVPFEPDAWQRQVLDSIDADESLLVVAPTSAGKTFISFYAMKCVLEESDDAVLVYVAPTKALVNQIAAEIEGRFSKSYHDKPGKSVWAIHTRDYRINNPTGCQILVTVPHILQIMLLAPENANNPNAWSRRVKRIIFDEVHCIGQAEDGVVWEQLLLLAPCPIIALSATVGNPDEFRDWLKVSRTQKDSKMTMIIHGVRYSDLRKFVYQSPPEGLNFKGLEKAPRLPVPGLDEGNGTSARFQFLHPIRALKDRNRETLDDLSLEARDCLTLWEKMNEKVPPGPLKKKVDALNPTKILPQNISKYDIVEWEKGLKATLREVIETSTPSLGTLQSSLDSEPERELSQTMTTTEIKSTVPLTPAADHVVSLFPLVCELHSQDALPALAFSYDRLECERAVTYILEKMEEKELEWKASDAGWLKKLKDYKIWENQKASARDATSSARGKARGGDAEGMTKLELARETGSTEISAWESFDPNAPLEDFSFADSTKLQKSEYDAMIHKLKWADIRPELLKALERGLGVHHEGMNRKYRQVVEMLFRRGYLRVVVATGTLALGINMPCKTVIFTGDTVSLTAQNYRQASGRAGRRGFDLLGNVVFNGIPQDRVYEIMSSRLPALKGQFPVSTTLILRLLGLLHGTENSDFAMNAAQALLAQTRLYLGGPGAELSVKHHLRFSIEYLRRQNLLSAQGKPLNFAGLVGHLYFTENSVFAFHSLLRGGFFHELCADIERTPEKVLPEMMLVLCHLFNRFPIRRTKELVDRANKSQSTIFLPRLPKGAETILIQHNKETLSIFRDCADSYISQHLTEKPDRTMPFTQTVVGPSEGGRGGFLGHTPTSIRSPFVALSGFGDKFDSIQDLCSTVRSDLFLEESTIPYIPVWPHDTDVELNAYILDFYKHGSMLDLVRENQIKGGDVWFYLQDFSRTLSVIETGLRDLAGLEAKLDGDEDSSDSEDEGPASEKVEAPSVLAPKSSNKAPVKAKAKVQDSWDDGSSDSESEATDTESPSQALPLLNKDQGGGLMIVLKAFVMLREEFDTKFKLVWA